MNRLKALRERTSVSLRDVERYTGISHTVLHLLENGQRQFREIHIGKLCHFFDVKADYLLGNSQEGIGVFFNQSADDDDHVFVSEKELDTIHVDISIVGASKPPTDDAFRIGDAKFYSGAQVYRSANINKEDASVEQSVRLLINQELDTLDIYDLEKVLKFIKEYIK